MLCGLASGIAFRPAISGPFFGVARRARRSGFAHLGLMLLGVMLGMLAVFVVIAGPLWLFGLLPLSGRGPIYVVAFMTGALAFVAISKRRSAAA